MKRFTLGLALIGALAIGAVAHEGMGAHDEAAESAQNVTVKGEVLDMACYLDHGGKGAKHASCAGTCIKSGLPVGLRAENGKTYLLIGEHTSINDQLVAYAGKTITVHGKAVSRDGFNMLENVEIVK